MSHDKLEVETIFRLYLDHSKREEDREIIVLVLNYLNFLFEPEDDEEDPEKILLEDLSSYEVDDFINFYLEDNFDNFKELQKKSVSFFTNFLKFVREKKYMSKEEIEEWKEVLR